MSFSSDIKEDLLTHPIEKSCCAAAEMAAMALLGGGISLLGRGRYALTIKSDSPAVIRYAYTQCKAFAGIGGELQTVRTTQLGEHLSYRMRLMGEDAESALSWLELRDPAALMGVKQCPPGGLMRRECCRRAYLRGAFLTCGWVEEPQKKYHLEFAAPDENQADVLLRMLRRCGVNAKSVARKSQHVVYVKESELVGTVLGLLGAHKAYLRLEDVRVMKDLRNDVNRQLNCDESNTNKALTAAEQQVRDILLIQEKKGLDSLPAPLKQIALARLGNQDLNLTQLGELLEPPIGKSGANNRMRRLSALAEELRMRSGEL